MKFELYKDRNSHWRWRLRAGNNKIIADSGEGYVNKKDAEDMIEKIIALNKQSVIITTISN